MSGQWWKEGIVYQIYPRSFMDTTGSGIGDINGIISKLDYLHSLGVTIIWLNPVYESPNDDNGYDISDYQAILAEFGTMHEFDQLLAGLHQRGMKLLMDLVVNHCSAEHYWFQEAKKSKDNAYRDYFFWQKGEGLNGDIPPNNWQSVFSGSAWQKSDLTDEYYLHIFSKKQPDLNWGNDRLRKSLYAMMNWWFERGVDGFRMDVINMISKVDVLPSVEGVIENSLAWGGKYFMNGPRLHEHLKELNRQVLSKWDCMTVGECFDIDVEQGRNLVGKDRKELDMLFQMEHMALDHGPGGKWDVQPEWSRVELKEILNKWIKGLESTGWCSQFWMNHDQPRAVSRFGDDKQFRELSAMALATITLALPGTPYIFQGEEIGMTNVKYNIDEYRDLEIINWVKDQKSQGKQESDLLFSIHEMGRDNARTPMQWNKTSQSGFSEGTPWIKVNPNYTEINVEAALANPKSIWHYYQNLISLRKQHLALVYGEFELLYPDDNRLFAFQRTWQGCQYQIWVNLSNDEMVLPEVISVTPLISNYTSPSAHRLKPWEALIGIKAENRVGE